MPTKLLVAAIGGTCVIAAAIVTAVVPVVFHQAAPEGNNSAAAAGDGAVAVAITGGVQGSQITIHAAGSEPPGISKEARAIIDSVLSTIGTSPDDSPMRELIDIAGESLKRNPYNTRALVMRGQYYYTQALSLGGQGLGEALSDFERATQIDKQIADPYFGIGTTVYYVALADIVRRGLWKIEKPGELKINTQTGAPEVNNAEFSINIDNRVATLLQDLLRAFKQGMDLRQDYSEDPKNGSFAIFPSTEIDERIRSIRSLLGYEPTYWNTEMLAALINFSKLEGTAAPRTPFSSDSKP